MTRYISILRGINVSGRNLIRMPALKKMYESLGFSNPISYLQSGNVIFSSDEKKPKKLEEIITRQINRDFGFTAPVIVFSPQTLKSIIQNNPLMADPQKDPAFFHVTFLASAPETFDKQSILDKRSSQEEVYFSEKALYLYCPNGYGTTKLNNNFLESKLKVTATTRNWKTSNELLRLSSE